jgi:hypothetical protein
MLAINVTGPWNPDGLRIYHGYGAQCTMTFADVCGCCRNEVNSATHEWHQVREEAMRKVAAAERRAQLDAQVKDLETQCAAAVCQIEELRRQMQPLEAERAQRVK